MKDGCIRDWCGRIDGILSENLTRPVLLAKENEFRLAKDFSVNLTDDLANALVEVQYLKELGFRVPEIAEELTNQKAKLTDVANLLQEMTNDYRVRVDRGDLMRSS